MPRVPILAEKVRVMRDVAHIARLASANMDVGNLVADIIGDLATKIENGAPYEAVIEHAIQYHQERRVMERRGPEPSPRPGGKRKR